MCMLRVLQATNDKLKADKAAQKQWDRWCDENCIAERWGGLGEGKCRGGVETGVVGCVCKQGIAPVSITKDGRIVYSPPAPPMPPPNAPPPLAPTERAAGQAGQAASTRADTAASPQQQAASAAAPATPAPAALPHVAPGKCLATNPTLAPSAVTQWSGWCDEQCSSITSHMYMWLPPLLHAVTGSVTYGYRLCHIRSRPLLRAITGATSSASHPQAGRRTASRPR